MNTLDHVGVTVSDFDKALAFYEAALRPLGITVVMRVGRAETGGKYQGAGFGRDNKPDFWVGGGPGKQPNAQPVHLAFAAASRAAVDAFYRAALAAGGTDNGAPGIRAHYHPSYYGAFVHDPDGHNVEAVTHQPE